MSAFKYKGSRIDEKSQIILQVLRARGTEVKTAYLRDALGEEDNKIVTYRMSEHLVPAGLVEKVGEEESMPNVRAAALWAITDEGRDWLDDRDEDVVRATDAAQVAEELRHVRHSVDGFSERLKRLERKHDNRTQTLQRHSDRLGKYQTRLSDVEELKDDVQSQLRTLESQGGEIDRLEERIEALETKIESTRKSDKKRNERLDDLEDEVFNEQSPFLSHLNSQQDDWDAAVRRVKRLEVKNEELSDEVDELREQVNTSVWDRLLPWR